MNKEEGTVICGELRPSRDLGGALLAGNDKHGEHPQTEGREIQVEPFNCCKVV